MSEARIKVSFVDGTLEIEGSETFVRAELEAFRPSIRGGLAKHETHAPAVEAAPTAPADGIDLSGIFTVSDRGAVHFVPDIPGKSRWQQIVNAAKLLAYGAGRLQNRIAVPFAEVKAECKAHRCHDAKNLSTVLKRDQRAFVLCGYNRKQTIALTESGMKDAEKLIRTLAPSALTGLKS